MILVTGATGLVGGHLIQHLLLENEKVTAIKRDFSDLSSLYSIFEFYGANASECMERIIWRNADVEDEKSLIEAFQNIEFVYHCAAKVNLGKNNENMLDVNVGGTKNVVNAALANQVKKLCFVSSIASLPDGYKVLIHEETPLTDNENSSMYGESKRLSEVEIKRGIEQGLKAVVVNPGVILGYSKSMSGSGELFKRVKKGLPFYTNGTTGYVAVQDVARAMIRLMKSDISDERFVLVGENCSHKDVLQWMADEYGKFRPFIGMEKSLLVSARFLYFFGRIGGFKPLIDASSAKISISKKAYSNRKFISQFPDFKFTPIRETIRQICQFDKRIK
ncbi:MAG: NAD-dependent epimerase/dehydratase family protein [Paludibacteraceae bacterium]